MPQRQSRRSYLKSPHRAFSHILQRREGLHNHTPSSYNLAQRRLINAESALGRSIFGPLRAGQQREFFCLKPNVWLWYSDGTTIRYEVRKEGVFKKVDHGHYHEISGLELKNFQNAARAYLQLVKTRLYN